MYSIPLTKVSVRYKLNAINHPASEMEIISTLRLTHAIKINTDIADRGKI